MKSMLFSTLTLIISCTIMITGCLFSGSDERAQITANSEGLAQVNLRLNPAALVRGEYSPKTQVDSVHIRISGMDMDPIDFGYKTDSLVFNLVDLPAGASRVINAELFKGQRMLYSGRGTFILRRETRLEAALICLPQFSRVTARFHLPLDLPMPIAAGSLKLAGKTGEFNAVLKKQGEFGSFFVDELPGDNRYDVSIALSDSVGKVRYEANRTAVFLPLGEETKWDLSLLPTEAQAGVALTLGSPKVAQLDFGFPSRLRSPRKPGEIIFSEFNAAPAERDSSTAGEWFELFNRSADTLVLAGCRISRDWSGGSTRSLAFDSAQFLLPGQALVFGRSAAKADVHYQDFTMVNTSASLILTCKSDSLVLDSLRYSSLKIDSIPVQLQPLLIREGWVTSLDMNLLAQRQSSQSWCLTKSLPISELVDAIASQNASIGNATPGRLSSCQE
jgi:hypothetical protein